MAARLSIRFLNFGNRFRLPVTVLALLVASLAAAPPAHGQAAAEYGGAAGVSASAVASKPQLFRPGGNRGPKGSRFLAKHSGTRPGQHNREWFAKQAGKDAATLTVDATPARSSVWVDGKFVGKAPLTLTLPAGKHHLSLLGPRQEHASRELDLTRGKKQHLSFHLEETYPSAVSIRVFGAGRR